MRMKDSLGSSSPRGVGMRWCGGTARPAWSRACISTPATTFPSSTACCSALGMKCESNAPYAMLMAGSCIIGARITDCPSPKQPLHHPPITHTTIASSTHHPYKHCIIHPSLITPHLASRLSRSSCRRALTRHATFTSSASASSRPTPPATATMTIVV